MKTLLSLVLLAPAASAQTVALRPVASAPVPVLAGPAAALAALPSLPAPALNAAPALTAAPALSAAPVLAAPTAAPAAAASGPEKAKSPAAERSAAALSEFRTLVAELMSGDAGRSTAAAEALRRLRDEHLNTETEGKKTDLLSLKPMQIPAGMYEVQDKAGSLRGMKKKEREDWMQERSVPYVEDYKGRKRPVDRHHETRAAWEAGLGEVYARRYLDDELHARVAGLDRAEFYAVTKAMGLFYDRDQFGAGPHDPDHLPEDVRSLADDPYRSVAWQVRKRGGFEKSAVPFAEFAWAAYFRERLKTYPTKADFEKSVTEAMRLVHAPEAKGLPGWTPR